MNLPQIGVLTGLVALACFPLTSAEAMPQKADRLTFPEMTPETLPRITVKGQPLISNSPAVTFTKRTPPSSETVSSSAVSTQPSQTAHNPALLSQQSAH
ncbi:hypothetical protein [Acaryochloris sp. IP29b_bin.148]|uniref:hypothetical protein n=1 Tax=Acaryochloris sp. IP29b_bin.148 TaxID=2969218 RepID=UPI00261E0692|nr:hypothetical protein [Acaryochloris sp. IP29b_bin.148]